MIVTTNPDNSDKYLSLFTEAYEYLQSLDGGYVDDKESGRFESLAEYYSHMADFFNNQKYKFIMLPIDEETLDINLDTRTINVPDSFTKCASVQSDHLAEMIVFTTDRYYDYMDLANTQIFVQWTIPENKLLGIEEVNGATRIEMIDLETEPEKLRFAWPLNDKITQYSGNVKFAVRFFTLDPSDLSVVTYSLNTTEATMTIKAALQSSLNDEAEVESPLADSSFKKVIINSNFPGEGQANPVQPAFTEPGSDIDGEGMFEVDGQKVFNLQDDKGSLKVQAWSADAGVYRYVWYYKNNKPNSGWYDCANYPSLDENNRPILNDNGEYVATSEWATATDEYVLVTPTERVRHERYYQLISGTYKLYTGKIPADVSLYERYNVLNLPATGEVTGQYKACVYNTVNNLVTRIPVFSSTCLLPGPQKIVFKEDGNLLNGMILPEDESGVNLLVATEEDVYEPSLSYKWRKSQSAAEEVLKENTSVWSNTQSNWINVNEPGWYSVEVVSTLNREETTKFSNVCKVTDFPEPPTVTPQGNALYMVAPGVPQTLKIEAKVLNPNDYGTELITEGIEYIWQIKLVDSGVDGVYITLTDDNCTGITGLGTTQITIDNTLTVNGRATAGGTMRCLVANILNGEQAIFDHAGIGDYDNTYEDPSDAFPFGILIQA